MCIRDRKTSEEGWLHNAIKKSKINTVVTVSAHKDQASGLCGRLAQYLDVYKRQAYGRWDSPA